MVPFAGYSMPLAYGDVGQGENKVCRILAFARIELVR